MVKTVWYWTRFFSFVLSQALQGWVREYLKYLSWMIIPTNNITIQIVTKPGSSPNPLIVEFVSNIRFTTDLLLSWTHLKYESEWGILGRYTGWLYLPRPKIETKSSFARYYKNLIYFRQFYSIHYLLTSRLFFPFGSSLSYYLPKIALLTGEKGVSV